ncbi:MAG: mandelate racemase/muconate lactonizing enzyme family protein, partial [Desulfobacteraceae bacterium]|nr:mandelate racemase/muconate lactonizing enzyme family protein [Desulfobacteraceae bacterium]
LGFEIDKDKLKKYGKKFFSMNKRKLMFYTIKDKGLLTALGLNSNKKKYGVDAKGKNNINR